MQYASEITQVWLLKGKGNRCTPENQLLTVVSFVTELSASKLNSQWLAKEINPSPDMAPGNNVQLCSTCPASQL